MYTHVFSFPDSHSLTWYCHIWHSLSLSGNRKCQILIWHCNYPTNPSSPHICKNSSFVSRLLFVLLAIMAFNRNVKVYFRVHNNTVHNYISIIKLGLVLNVCCIYFHTKSYSPKKMRKLIHEMLLGIMP